mgnify:CR=1 FL=1
MCMETEVTTMILRTLASSSSGNCILVQSGNTNPLLDAGISCRKITQRLKECGLTPADLTGILVTHEHTDHVAGLSVLLKKRHIPIYTSEGTCNALAFRQPEVSSHLMVAPAGSYFELGNVTITSFPTSHDVADPMGFRFALYSEMEEDGSGGDLLDAIGWMTDTGYVTNAALDGLYGVRILGIESNHDVEML